MADSRKVLESSLKFRNGRKWKRGYCVLQKMSPVADCLHICLYKDKNEMLKNVGKPGFSLDTFFGIDSGFYLDKESYIMAVICKDNVLMFAFDSQQMLECWLIAIRTHLGEEAKFLASLVKSPVSLKLSNGPIRIFIHREAVCLTTVVSNGIPPKYLTSWKLSTMRRFGILGGQYCFEVADHAVCGIFVLDTKYATQMDYLLKEMMHAKSLRTRNSTSGLCYDEVPVVHISPLPVLVSSASSGGNISKAKGDLVYAMLNFGRTDSQSSDSDPEFDVKAVTRISVSGDEITAWKVPAKSGTWLSNRPSDMRILNAQAAGTSPCSSFQLKPVPKLKFDCKAGSSSSGHAVSEKPSSASKNARDVNESAQDELTASHVNRRYSYGDAFSSCIKYVIGSLTSHSSPKCWLHLSRSLSHICCSNLLQKDSGLPARKHVPHVERFLSLCEQMPCETSRASTCESEMLDGREVACRLKKTGYQKRAQSMEFVWPKVTENTLLNIPFSLCNLQSFGDGKPSTSQCRSPMKEERNQDSVPKPSAHDQWVQTSALEVRHPADSPRSSKAVSASIDALYNESKSLNGSLMCKSQDKLHIIANLNSENLSGSILTSVALCNPSTSLVQSNLAADLTVTTNGLVAGQPDHCGDRSCNFMHERKKRTDVSKDLLLVAHGSLTTSDSYEDLCLFRSTSPRSCGSTSSNPASAALPRDSCLKKSGLSGVGYPTLLSNVAHLPSVISPHVQSSGAEVAVYDSTNQDVSCQGMRVVQNKTTFNTIHNSGIESDKSICAGQSAESTHSSQLSASKQPLCMGVTNKNRYESDVDLLKLKMVSVENGSIVPSLITASKVARIVRSEEPHIPREDDLCERANCLFPDDDSLCNVQDPLSEKGAKRDLGEGLIHTGTDHLDELFPVWTCTSHRSRLLSESSVSSSSKQPKKEELSLHDASDSKSVKLSTPKRSFSLFSRFLRNSYSKGSPSLLPVECKVCEKQTVSCHHDSTVVDGPTQEVLPCCTACRISVGKSLFPKHVNDTELISASSPCFTVINSVTRSPSLLPTSSKDHDGTKVSNVVLRPGEKSSLCNDSPPRLLSIYEDDLEQSLSHENLLAKTKSAGRPNQSALRKSIENPGRINLQTNVSPRLSLQVDSDVVLDQILTSATGSSSSPRYECKSFKKSESLSEQPLLTVMVSQMNNSVHATEQMIKSAGKIQAESSLVKGVVLSARHLVEPHQRQRLNSNQSESSVMSCCSGSSYNSEILGCNQTTNIYRPRSGKEYGQIDRRKLLDESHSLSSSAPPASSVFTFDMHSASTYNCWSSGEDSPKYPLSLCSQITSERSRAYANLSLGRDGSLVIMDDQSSCENQSPVVNYAEIDLTASPSDASSISVHMAKPGVEHSPTIYAQIDMVATCAASRASREHAQQRKDKTDRAEKRASLKSTSNRAIFRKASMPMVKRGVIDAKHGLCTTGKDRKFSPV